MQKYLLKIHLTAQLETYFYEDQSVNMTTSEYFMFNIENKMICGEYFTG